MSDRKCNLDQSCFSSAVLTEQSEDSPVFNSKGHVVQSSHLALGPKVPESLRNGFDLERRRHMSPIIYRDDCQTFITLAGSLLRMNSASASMSAIRENRLRQVRTIL